MQIQIIGADERFREVRGVKALILGPAGVGKTTLLRTLDPASTLFVDVEAGDLAVLDLLVPTIRVDDWQTARNLVCKIGGPNPSFPPTACYSPAHYEAIGGALEDLDRYENIFVDSLTAITRLSLRWAEQQAEVHSERTGRKDTRSAYGLLGREMVLWLNQLQHARAKNIVLVGVLERVVDELNVATWQLQAEGSKTARELPGIIDEVISSQFLDFGDGKPPTRGFVCTAPNPWLYPAKDRSGRLDQIEPPDLGKLLSKLTNKPKRAEAMTIDFNGHGGQRSFDVIPNGTICTLQMKIRPGGAGDGGWLKTAADGASEGLDCEFTVVDGEFAKRKLWNRFTLSGTKENHATAGDISRRTLRAILESARGIRPDDKSEAATNARKISGWQDMEGIRFVARLGVLPARGGYKSKNTIDEVITCERTEWRKIEQVATPAVMATSQSAPATPPAGAIARPIWAE